MDNNLKSAFPHLILEKDRLSTTEVHHGLSKREYFAGLALQGFAARGFMMDSVYIEEAAKRSVKAADALLLQLQTKEPWI